MHKVPRTSQKKPPKSPKCKIIQIIIKAQRMIIIYSQSDAVCVNKIREEFFLDHIITKEYLTLESA